MTNPDTTASDPMTELFGDIIHAYTRGQAITDGTLVDVTTTAREAGITHPTVLTREVWADCVAWDEATENHKPQYTGQDEAGRLWDVLWMAATYMRAAKRRGAAGSNRLRFEVLRVPATGRGVRPRKVALELVVGPGDDWAPVITVQFPGQD